MASGRAVRVGLRLGSMTVRVGTVMESFQSMELGVEVSSIPVYAASADPARRGAKDLEVAETMRGGGSSDEGRRRMMKGGLGG